MESLVKFWDGLSVMVTGHTGFKGSWLSTWLQRLGSNVSGYALAPPTQPNLFEVGGVEEGMSSVFGNINDYSALEGVFAAKQPQVVFHLAAQPLVRESYTAPRETYMTNVMGTLNVLEAARTHQVAVVVVITTDKCYENREWLWPYREHDALGGHDPYSASKACAEIVCASYRRSFCMDGLGPRIATARAGNVLGGGDWAKERLVPDIARAFAAGHSPDLRNPGAIRPWQHVLEPLWGYLLLAEKLWHEGDSFAEAWNFGPSESDCRPVADVVRLMAGAWGVEELWSHDTGKHPHEASLLKLDSSKARARLDWRPRWNLEQTLRHTTDFYRAYYEGKEVQSLLQEQIASYECA